jgi:hypothetical protein
MEQIWPVENKRAKKSAVLRKDIWSQVHPKQYYFWQYLIENQRLEFAGQMLKATFF